MLDHRCALTARVLTHLSAKDCPVWQKEKEIPRLRIEKRIPFPEARRLVESSLPSVLPASAAFSHSNIVSRKRVQSVECQTDLSWVSSDNPIQAVSISGRPGSASAGTQASSGSNGPASADTRVLRNSLLTSFLKVRPNLSKNRPQEQPLLIRLLASLS